MNDTIMAIISFLSGFGLIVGLYFIIAEIINIMEIKNNPIIKQKENEIKDLKNIIKQNKSEIKQIEKAKRNYLKKKFQKRH